MRTKFDTHASYKMVLIKKECRSFNNVLIYNSLAKRSLSSKCIVKKISPGIFLIVMIETSSPAREKPDNENFFLRLHVTMTYAHLSSREYSRFPCFSQSGFGQV